MTAKQRDHGLHVWCPSKRSHRLIRARFGAAPTARGGQPSLLLVLARAVDPNDWRVRDRVDFVEVEKDGSDVDWIDVSCPCKQGSMWMVKVDRLPALVPNHGVRDVVISDVAIGSVWREWRDEGDDRSE